MKRCGSCTYYERVGTDYGDCRIHPLYSYVHCNSNCEDFNKKNTNKGKKNEE